MIRISRHVRKEMMRQYKVVLIVGALAIPSFAISQLSEMFLELWDEEDPARKIALADELLPDARHNEKQCAWLHVFRGQGYKALDRIDEARAAFDRAAKLDDENATAHVGSASCSMKLKEYSSAVDSFRRALHIDPSRTNVHASLGLAFIHLAEWSSARKTFEELKQRDASDARAWAGLGIVHANEGRKFDAWFCLQRAQELSPELGWTHSLEIIVERSKVDNEVFDLVVGALTTPQDSSRWHAGTARFLALREPLQALALARRWVEAQPGNHEAESHLVLLLYGCRFPAEAAAGARRIAMTRPGEDLRVALVQHAALMELDMHKLADMSLRGQFGAENSDPWLTALAHYRVGDLEREQIDALVEAAPDDETRAVRMLERELFAPKTIQVTDLDSLSILEIIARSATCERLAPLAEAVIRASPDTAVAALGVTRSIEPSWPWHEDLRHWLEAVPDGFFVQLPAHVFVNDGLFFTEERRNLTLRGRTNKDGTPATMILFSNPSASTPVASFYDCDRLTLEAICFAHAKKEASATRENVLNLIKCDAVTLRNCRLTRGSNGLYASKGTNLVIEGLRIEHMTQAGLWLDGTDGISLTEIRLDECNTFWMGEGNTGPFHEQGNMRGLYNVWHPEMENGNCH